MYITKISASHLVRVSQKMELNYTFGKIKALIQNVSNHH